MSRDLLSLFETPNYINKIQDDLNVWSRALQVSPEELLEMSDVDIENRVSYIKRKMEKDNSPSSEHSRARGGAEVRELACGQGLDDVDWGDPQGGGDDEDALWDDVFNNPNSMQEQGRPAYYLDDPNWDTSYSSGYEAMQQPPSGPGVISRSTDYTRSFVDDTVNETEYSIEVEDLPDGSRMVTVNSRTFIVGDEDSANTSRSMASQAIAPQSRYQALPAPQSCTQHSVNQQVAACPINRAPPRTQMPITRSTYNLPQPTGGGVVACPLVRNQMAQKGWTNAQPYQTERFSGLQGVQKQFQGQYGGQNYQGRMQMANRRNDNESVYYGHQSFHMMD